MLVALEARAPKPPPTDPTTARPRMTQIPIFKSLSKLMASKNLKIALKPCGTLLLSKISLALPAGLASLTGLVGLAAGMSLPAAAGSVNWSSSCAPSNPSRLAYCRMQLLTMTGFKP